jgi:predicted DNA-binding transcriptional regulator AlpA
MTTTDNERLSRAAVLKMLGGDKPVHVSTLYRLMHADRFPPPVKLSTTCAGWIRSEVEAALERMVAERDVMPKQTGSYQRRRAGD